MQQVLILHLSQGVECGLVSAVPIGEDNDAGWRVPNLSLLVWNLTLPLITFFDRQVFFPYSAHFAKSMPKPGGRYLKRFC